MFTLARKRASWSAKARFCLHIDRVPSICILRPRSDGCGVATATEIRDTRHARAPSLWRRSALASITRTVGVGLSVILDHVDIGASAAGMGVGKRQSARLESGGT